MYYMSGIVVSYFKAAAILVFILQVMKLKHREVRQLGQDHTVCQVVAFQPM